MKAHVIAVGCALLNVAMADARAVAGAARFDSISYESLDATSLNSGQYRNPVLPGFQPDPSIVKVGADFYLVNSTFGWFPGLPIYHSRDLTHWTLIGHAIDRADQLSLMGLGVARGLFAAAISHHAGRFWIVNTCIDCGGNFVISAERPEGPWSKPVWLDFGGIDPSLFFDDDGQAWITYNDAAPGVARYEGHRALWLRKFDTRTMSVDRQAILLVDGGVRPEGKPVWAEGPHIYRTGGFYYLMAAEGGTAEHHSETIYRAKAVTGPYVPGPRNPILTQRDLPKERKDRVEATGHADIVVLDDGSWWGVFLATRPFVDQSTLLGRETFLLPVRWVEGWPQFLEPGTAVPLVAEAPALKSGPGTDWSRWRDDFSTTPGPEWVMLRAPLPTGVATVKHGALFLAPLTETPAGTGTPAFLGRRLRSANARHTLRFSFRPDKPGDAAGLLAFMDQQHFLSVGLEQGGLVVRRRSASDDPAEGVALARIPSTPATVDVRLDIHGGSASVDWRPAGSSDWRAVARAIDVEPLATVHAGLFTGLVVGPFAVRAPEQGSP